MNICATSIAMCQKLYIIQSCMYIVYCIYSVLPTKITGHKMNFIIIEYEGYNIYCQLSVTFSATIVVPTSHRFFALRKGVARSDVD